MINITIMVIVELYHPLFNLLTPWGHENRHELIHGIKTLHLLWFNYVTYNSTITL
jgi:hypothetical protein